MSNIDPIGAKKKIEKQKVEKLASKPEVIIEKKEGVGATAAPVSQQAAQEIDIKKIEIEMEQADHAFALMTEIRERIERAYQEIQD